MGERLAEGHAGRCRSLCYHGSCLVDRDIHRAGGGGVVGRIVWGENKALRARANAGCRIGIFPCKGARDRDYTTAERGGGECLTQHDGRGGRAGVDGRAGLRHDDIDPSGEGVVIRGVRRSESDALRRGAHRQ